jgi:hypothetical protein
MIKVCVRKKNFQPIGLEVFAHLAHAASGIEYHSHLWQHEASRMSPVGRIIPAGAKQNYLHGDKLRRSTTISSRQLHPASCIIPMLRTGNEVRV